MNQSRILKQFEGESGKIKLISLVSSGILAVMAIVVFCVAGFGALNAFPKVLLIIIGILMLIGTAEIVLLTFFVGEDAANYFLFESARGKNLPPESLTLPMIEKKMDGYIAHIARNKGQLWIPGYLEQCDFLGMTQFCPAVACQMLIDLCRVDSEAGWKCFSSANPTTVAWIADTLTESGVAPKFAADLRQVKRLYGADPKKVREFLMKTQKYLEGCLFRYVKGNLGAFDGVSL